MAIGSRNTIVVKGLGRVVAGFKKWEMLSNSNVNITMQQALILVEAQAKRLVSSGKFKAVDTGRMRASITSQITKFNKKRIEGQVGVGVHYAIYVHEGTERMMSRPFLLQALKDEKKNIRKIIRQAYGGIS